MSRSYVIPLRSLPSYNKYEVTTNIHKYITAGELAQQLDVRKPTIYRWISRGQVQVIRLPGGHFRIPAEEVERCSNLKAEQQLGD